MNILIGLKSGEKFYIQHDTTDFRSFVQGFYKTDVQVYEEIAIRVSEVEYIMNQDKFLEVMDNDG